MTPERWHEVKAILGEALDAPPDARMAFVDQKCAGDAALRDEVLSLLAAADSGDSLATAGLALDRDSALLSILALALGQQYEILRPLGRGGMGAVYLARERALERFVAIKVLRPDLAAAPDGRERFRREARVVAQLSHPGILPLHTFGEVRGLWYFVMGYVRGISLAERLRLEGRIPAAEAHRILAELADALECAHRHGVIHRDIKPANILLDDESGRAMLADFGISKVEGVGDSLTGTGVAIGTPHFMSPEQSLGNSTVDERSDLYSLGAVGYAMLAGHEPFADVAMGELMFRRLSQDAPPLHTVAKSVPADLSAVVMRCLARDPAARWPNARNLREGLARAAGDASALLPESLREVPTFGPYAVAWGVAWTALAIRPWRDPGDRVLLLLIAATIPVGFVFHIWNVGRHGLGSLGLARVAFWPPEWWGMWWPRSLRRPTDVWPRLPWAARGARIAVTLFIAALPAMILLQDAIIAPGADRGSFPDIEAAMVIGAAAATTAALWWAYRRGLTWPETFRLMFGATAMSPAWSNPSITRWMTPAGGGARHPERDTPGEHRRAIADLTAMLPASVADIGKEVVTSAQRLFLAIETCDVEAGALARDGSSTEFERLTSRLGTLEADANTDTVEHREMLELVRRQLDLVRRMRIRSELLSERRTRLFNLLRGLWTQLRLVRDADAEGAAVAPTLIARLHALCAEVNAAIEAEHPRV